ncbi:MAG: S8 family peptidase [Bdellovibrionota bacterium]
MLLLQKMSRPVFVSILLLSACSKAPERGSYRGLPSEPVLKSFKIQMKSTAEGKDHDLSDLTLKLQNSAQKVGCAVDSVAPITWEAGAVSSELSQSYHVALKDCDLDKDSTDQALLSFSEEDFVEAAEAEAVIRLNVAENDQGKAQQTYLSQISRDEVCDLLPADAPQIIVAVIDSGVEVDHPDLINAFARDSDGQVIGANFVGKGSRLAPDSNWGDQNGHGTHVAGIVAATSNNKIGITGVAGCANVRIMPVRVMGANGSGSSLEIDRGVQWAMAHGADIINLSLGSNVSFRRAQASHPNPLYTEAAARGVMVFAAAGNESLTLGQNQNAYVYSYPASYDHVISVAALDSKGNLARFSNRGETVDIAAPGVEILSTYMGKGYRRESGTSMASPVAAGAYALALSASRQKARPSSSEVEDALILAVDRKNLDTEDVLSAGVMNVKTLVGIIAQPNPTEAELTPNSPVEMPEEVNEGPEQELSPPKIQAMNFAGLTEGMNWARAQTISVEGWPKGKAARIYLYWVTAKNPTPTSFVILNRSHLSEDGLSVTTTSAYKLYGEGKLVAEAVDAEGDRLSVSEIAIQGL